MGIKLRRLAATLLLSPCPAAYSATDAHQAVMRATAHHPSTSPPSAHHLDALLAFGRGSRLSAAAVAAALVDRLRASASGQGDPYVALKCLVALRVLLAKGAFILRDQLVVALARHPASGRNPLALASFPLGRRSFAAASWVRFSARLLELLLLLPDAHDAGEEYEYLSALPNSHLVAELAAFAAVADAVRGAPPPQGSALVWEAVRLAEEDRVCAERNVAARVREMGDRIDTLSLADAVELVCVLRRVEESAAAKSASPAPEWKWAAMDEGVVCAARRVREKAEEVVLRRTGEERRVLRRDADEATASARVGVPRRAGAGDAVRFGSRRWDGARSAAWH
ncbi:hypothetical protein PR202_ga15571 [Eleusine coracana subsp. coracana]|uniref:ENTH domain-containing protein n=1 Tax=Eleusine coracana subsp. coracana TaxID=191504 RepID=A0AAV5CKF7_ELECO|nr:hypothetical protein PR202_ga15571 [Eleusine coracana subsp. coracana]